MWTLTNLLLTAGVALYVLAVLAGLMCLAAVLPGAWALLVLPLVAVNGFVAGEVLGAIWQSETGSELRRN